MDKIVHTDDMYGMAVAKDDNDIVKAQSAYIFFQKINTKIIRDEIVAEGKDTSDILAIVSSRWKELTEAEKDKYTKMANEDKERYHKECAARDAEILRRQEEKRKQNSMTETDTRIRHSTLASSEAIMVKESAPKKTREVSEEEKAAREERKQAKAKEDKNMSSQHAELKKIKLEQAEARLKYLLSQSDIFSHFGATAQTIKNNPPPRSQSMASIDSQSSNTQSKGKSKSKHRHGKDDKDDMDEMDEDEKAMAAEVDEDNEEDEAPLKKKSSHLFKQPSCISGGQMRPYQLEGLNWMISLTEKGINGILADEMGLGKTLQSISVLGYMHEFVGVTGPHLVMVPKSTLSNWMNEFKRWCPVLKVIKFHGNKEERDVIIREQIKPTKMHSEREWDVCVTTYEILNLEKGPLTKIAWRYLIIDEAHRLKNEASQFSQTVRQLDTQYRLLLTGTPLQNNLHELWALLNFLLPDVFSSSEQFDEWFNLDVDDTEAKQRIISQLHKILRPFMLRRLKVDVEKSLPPKTETVIFAGLTSIQKDLYKKILLRDIATINGGNSGSHSAILNIVMQLRKCCNHPYLFPGIEDRSMDPMGDHLYKNCGKMLLLDKLLSKLKERGHRVLLFSQMTRMLDIIEDYLFSKGYSYCRIDGNTTYDEREDRIADYNREKSDKFIFILSTRAGGLGINLQTADTVILYDSDWNPQADLQAQDRAHRIGQKRVVQVFRLVTDETVEVKVVERAQQKLKLDAMVVQQGRLQEKEKKLSKQDLLETIRFGADKIFRSKESTVTDDDIDMILEQGRKRTEEMNEKLKLADKGDMYDFSLDGGMKSQVFEGTDYSKKGQQSKESFIDPYAGFGFIDTGKRERKTVNSYAEQINRSNQAAEGDGNTRPKLPRHLRLPKMEDFQFFDKNRLLELQEEEQKLFDAMVDKGENHALIGTSKLEILSPELAAEKNHLLSQGFADWTKVQFNTFVRVSGKYGRHEYEKMAKDIGKSPEEVKRYADAFWSVGSTLLPAAEWERNFKNIEKGEKRLEEIDRLTKATSELIAMFEDPWEELTFKNVGNQGRIFNAAEDRFLLCLTHLHGYGSWDLVRSSIRRSEHFRFDFYLQSCSAENLGKRCETLMKAAERELEEIKRKKASESSMSITVTNGKKGINEGNKDRVADLARQIKEESDKLTKQRKAIKVLKGEGSQKAPGVGKGDGKEKADGEETKGRGGGGGRGIVAKPVPEELMPDLCKTLMEMPSDGVNKCVTAFMIKHNDISKRQIEMKIGEIATKEKRAGDSKQVWHIKSEYQHYLTMETPSYEASSSSSATKKRKVDSDNNDSNKKAKGSEKIPKAKGDDKAVKRPREEGGNSNSNSNSNKKKEVSSKDDNDNDNDKPKKKKTAFGLWVKDSKGRGVAALNEEGLQGSAPDWTERLKNKLRELWENESAEVVAKYNAFAEKYNNSL